MKRKERRERRDESNGQAAKKIRGIRENERTKKEDHPVHLI
jgi:hypothetical protein